MVSRHPPCQSSKPGRLASCFVLVRLPCVYYLALNKVLVERNGFVHTCAVECAAFTPLNEFRASQITSSSEASQTISPPMRPGCLLISAERNSNNKIGKHLQVFVRENNVDQALRILKKKMQREGIFREMKRRKAYEKPSERKTREKAEAIRRARKAARKQAQREGLIPAPKRRDDTRGVGRGRPRFGSGAA